MNIRTDESQQLQYSSESLWVTRIFVSIAVVGFGAVALVERALPDVLFALAVGLYAPIAWRYPFAYDRPFHWQKLQRARMSRGERIASILAMSFALLSLALFALNPSTR